MPWLSIIELKTPMFLSTLVQDMQTALVEDMQMCIGMHETSPSQSRIIVTASMRTTTRFNASWHRAWLMEMRDFPGLNK
jgi:hypothetical protein